MGNRGFTAIDLLTAVTIAAILIGAAVPTFSATIQRSRLDAATRQVVSEIRKAQSLAVTRSGVFGFHWGGDPNIIGFSNSQYRIELDPTGACAWPAAGASMADPNPDVITDWLDLSGPFPGVRINSVRDNNNVILGGVIFDTIGSSVNTCTAVAFPLTVTLMDNSGGTRTIEVRSAGSVRIL
jgi:type II secretory pathway pseudopilin PulG